MAKINLPKKISFGKSGGTDAYVAKFEDPWHGWVSLGSFGIAGVGGVLYAPRFNGWCGMRLDWIGVAGITCVFGSWRPERILANVCYMIPVAHMLVFMMSESSSELCFDAVIAIYSDFRVAGPPQVHQTSYIPVISKKHAALMKTYFDIVFTTESEARCNTVSKVLPRRKIFSSPLPGMNCHQFCMGSQGDMALHRVLAVTVMCDNTSDSAQCALRSAKNIPLLIVRQIMGNSRKFVALIARSAI
ncbi:uncharacterized protein BO96DRAFT_463964 [Aspergillus niger CBS 101883]|uniref:uncharacterized protein n=1 Tax=Aspergillus lacticoffeatus (strain CBS 101883) TaxID=1450533 RepID=UPI000D7F8BCD|nr:uncharacterized protein BO96DRAFT_463964 [Aspergillus niger CBS 101883]PYH59498.1 hypothetical protein BO96DRAFT_463964 [Aspergillus niger CBS 101883]